MLYSIIHEALLGMVGVALGLPCLPLIIITVTINHCQPFYSRFSVYSHSINLNHHWDRKRLTYGLPQPIHSIHPGTTWPWRKKIGPGHCKRQWMDANSPAGCAVVASKTSTMVPESRSLQQRSWTPGEVG